MDDGNRRLFAHSANDISNEKIIKTEDTQKPSRELSRILKAIILHILVSEPAGRPASSYS